MMTKLITVVFLLLTTAIKSQSNIQWSENYQLQLSDFQSNQGIKVEERSYSLMMSSGVEFQMHMTNAEFIFTKNFNSKVSCVFSRSASHLIAPDSATALSLLNFARYGFDLNELYARKFRKQLFETKQAFSDVRFVEPLYEANQKEMNDRFALANNLIDLGNNIDKLRNLHLEVLNEIKDLSEFCKQCKPKRKKKSE